MIRVPTTEHSPLSALDELPVHQTTQPIRVVATSDPRAYERYWFTGQDVDGAHAFMLGIGFYPNLGTVDGYLAVSTGSTHTTVRAHRILSEDRTDVSVGPIRAEVVEPFREWHLTVGDNPQGLGLDVRWRDTKRAVFHQIPGGPRPGQLPQDTSGYETFGRIEGTLTVGGRTIPLAPASTWGSRDHHWGTRNGVGGPAITEPLRGTYAGQWVEFADFGLWGPRVLFNLGDDRPGAEQVSRVDARLRFDPETDHLVGGVIHNHLRSGEVKTVTYEQVPHRVIYLRTGLYLGPDGVGEPEHGYQQGTYLGDDVVVDGATYDVSDPKTRIRIGGFEDHVMRATCDGEETIGLIETNNPLLYQMCKHRVNGYRLLED